MSLQPGPNTQLVCVAVASVLAALYVLRRQRQRRCASAPVSASSPFLPLSTADLENGLHLMHPVHGYRHLCEDDLGLVQPFDFDLPTVKALRRRFALSARDVVIATYPKCGTTWMQQLILLLLRGADAEPFAPMRDAPWIEMSASSAANGQPASSPPIPIDSLCSLPPPAPSVDRGWRVWKTHSPEPHAPWRGGGGAGAAAAGARVVVVCRNSKDAAISLLHHTKNIPPFAFVGGWAEFAPLFLDGRVESSSFWAWHEGWYRAARAHPETILWISFERMKADLPAVARQVGQAMLPSATCAAHARHRTPPAPALSVRPHRSQPIRIAPSTPVHPSSSHLTLCIPHHRTL